MVGDESGEPLGGEALLADAAPTDPTDSTHTRHVRRQAIGIVSAALVLVALAAVVIERRGRGGPDTFGTLQAPVTAADLERAELARRVADAILQLEGEQDSPAAGFRSTRRGWVFGNERNGDDASLAESLIDVDETIRGLAEQLNGGDDVLVYECGESFGVFVPSSARVAGVDTAWWADNECSVVPTWLIDAPRYFVVGANR